jgi:CHAT domain-containing protein
LQSLQLEAESLEKELVQKSEAFATLKDKRVYSWKDVQAQLKPGEAAVEMVRVRKKGVEKVFTDSSGSGKLTFQLLGLSDTVWYVACILKPGMHSPEMVFLKNGNELEGKGIRFYNIGIRKMMADDQSYNQFWKPINEKLGPDVKRVYFSPDGIYNSLNLNTLKNAGTGQFLLEEKDMITVTSTRDIVANTNGKHNENYACLVGYPEFNADKTRRAKEISRERKAPEVWYNPEVIRSDAFAELPSTKTEVENISVIMNSKGWTVENLLGEKALEDRVKEVELPRVLHIATHGYFQPDTSKNQNPLTHSGLLLSGANKTLAGEKSDDTDDGILTAFEAMNLNLDNTDLVVLSACETGLGEIKNGEGVYGLQRAFKVAGAKSIIMSLWKVSDLATQQLMVSFYKHWLSPPAPEGGANTTLPLEAGGPGLRAAFLKAQKELKAKYPDPYYWGAFVMLGE